MIFSSQSFGILLGGLLPAVLFGVCNIFAKASMQTGISLGLYLLLAGLSIAFVGVCFLFVVPGMSITFLGGIYSVGFGATWGLGAGFVALAVSRYHAPLARIVPLFNMNTLIAVLLSLWIFAEWRDVHVFRLLAGALFIVIGGILVAL